MTFIDNGGKIMKNKFNVLFLILILICSLAFVGCNNKDNETNTPEITYTLSISTAELKMEVGKKADLYAGYNDKDSISFTVSDNTVISIETKAQMATVTALKEGVSFIDVEVDGQIKTCKVIVSIPEYEVKLDKVSGTGTVMIGVQHEINATVYKNGAETNEEVSWEVIGAEYTVNGNTIVLIAKTAGECKVIAKYSNKTAEYTFTAVVSPA